MLTDAFFYRKTKKIISLFQGLEDFIMRDIARRLLGAGRMTGTADRLLWKLQQAGKSRDAIQAELSQVMRKGEDEIKTILEDTVLTAWEDDKATLDSMGAMTASPLESEAVKTVINAEYKKTLGEFENLTKTTLGQGYKDLINLMDEADVAVSSGVKSYNQAIRDVLDAYAAKGTFVTYPSGTRRSLEAAVRCCIVTSMNQTAAQVSNQYIKECGCEYVLVSAHLGARTGEGIAGHDNWQGRVYKIRGSDPDAPNLAQSTGYDINTSTGVGSVVDPLGLHGYNCRHSHKPWDKDLRNPYVDTDGKLKIDTEESRKRYELSQKQRAIERQIRRLKREKLVKDEELEAADDGDRDKVQMELDTLNLKLTTYNKKYNDFCKENGLAPQYDRTEL